MPLTTETMVLNMGPHHHSTHGVLRFILRTDGEVIHLCRPDIGYVRRVLCSMWGGLAHWGGSNGKGRREGGEEGGGKGG